MEKRSLLTRIEKPKNEKLGKTSIINQTKKIPKAKKIQSKSVSPIQVNSSLKQIKKLFRWWKNCYLYIILSVINYIK